MTNFPMNSDRYRYAICRNTGAFDACDALPQVPVSEAVLTDEFSPEDWNEDFIVMGLTFDQIIAYVNNHVDCAPSICLKNGRIVLTAYFVYQDNWKDGEFDGWSNLWPYEEFAGAVGRLAKDVKEAEGID